jgi:transcriptional regulator GlxA family with amidase domain
VVTTRANPPPCNDTADATDLPIPEVARRAGFGSEVTMRQHFASRLATSPRAYRAAFSTGSATGGSSPIAR